MSKETRALTLNPELAAFQAALIAQYAEANRTAQKGQTVFVGSSLMEIFPIEKWQEDGEVAFDHRIYNRAVRATTTAFLLVHLDTQVFDLEPSKVFVNIGTNDIGFGVPEDELLANRGPGGRVRVPLPRRERRSGRRGRRAEEGADVRRRPPQPGRLPGGAGEPHAVPVSGEA
jgi:hypothetical protein